MKLEEMSTEQLREEKRKIEAELSKRHKAKEDEKCCCWTCGHCFHDDNAHPSRRLNRDGYKCMLWSKKGRLIETKHKAPSWCPLKSKAEESGICNDCKNNLHRGDGTTYCATGDGRCHFEKEEVNERI